MKKEDKSIPFNCHRLMKFTSSICVQCSGIYHAACLKRNKGWKKLDDYNVICSKTCKENSDNCIPIIQIAAEDDDKEDSEKEGDDLNPQEFRKRNDELQQQLLKEEHKKDELVRLLNDQISQLQEEIQEKTAAIERIKRNISQFEDEWR
ncbi:hypothetical protein HHI36_016992 [Cryptolaemus montrouzieri]|uniref:Zinc finger PHD-type domain-containing protein n=1 Tax=Cryptolaemus montrouzieri TaxID=559131 RepID=A0ABD2NM11_9CUCU